MNIKNKWGILNKCGNKKGSYIVEAAITLPIFIISCLMLILIINIISSVEQVIYMTTLEIKDMALTNFGNSQNLEYDINSKIKNGEFKVEELSYLYGENSIDNLIKVKGNCYFNIVSKLGIKGDISFNETIIGRYFNGSSLLNNPLSLEYFLDESDSEVVVVFPRYGLRYHHLDCKYMKIYGTDERYYLIMERNDAKLKGYSKCLVCFLGDNEYS